MTDIVDRLRNADLTLMLPDGSIKYVNHVAADEIERLREALRPFVEPCIEHCHETCESEEERMEDCICFKARTVLKEKK